ncbi:MAG TPA: DMT family transporter [Nevskia sp.]|nr:DMT family transporter [Nevskia sp.]
MKAGIVYAVLACAGWGFAFIGPVLLRDWPAAAVAAGRYIAYGLWSLLSLLVLRARRGPRPFDRDKWRAAILLTLAGNLVYYVLLSASLQRAGVVLPTLIIGLLPVTVSLAGRLRAGQKLSAVYGLALGLILAGLLLANRPQPGALQGPDTVGLLYAFGSLALWTVYGVLNADWLRAHPQVGGVEWSSLQGAGALPFALLLFAADPGQPAAGGWLPFLGISLALGVLTSWAANAAWNLASQRLPGALLGQLIVFETVFGIGYGAIRAGAWPPLPVLCGAALLIAGVVLAIREGTAA